MSGFTYSVVASSLHDATALHRFVSPITDALDALGGRPADQRSITQHTPHVVVVATGGTEQRIVELVAERRSNAPWEPVVLLSHRFHNSLPAALEALARIQRDGTPGRIVQNDEPDEPATSITDLMTIHWFRHARLGLIGTPSDWLVASVPDRDRLRSRWGIELVDVPIEEPMSHYRDAPDVDVQAVAVHFTPRGEPARATIEAAALHAPLVGVATAHRLDAMAVRCFDMLTELHTSGCVALAQLNDDGFVAGCEGDVAATVAMMLVRRLLDSPSWIANPARVDPAAGELVLAHCTVAPSLVDDVELHTHFESGLGVGVRGTFAPGPVTLLRFGGDELERSWIREGEIVGSGTSDDLCRTQVDIRGVDDLDDLLESPLGNHLVMVRGRHRRRLERWSRLAHGSRALAATP